MWKCLHKWQNLNTGRSTDDQSTHSQCLVYDPPLSDCVAVYLHRLWGYAVGDTGKLKVAVVVIYSYEARKAWSYVEWRMFCAFGIPQCKMGWNTEIQPCESVSKHTEKILNSGRTPILMINIPHPHVCPLTNSCIRWSLISLSSRLETFPAPSESKSGRKHWSVLLNEIEPCTHKHETYSETWLRNTDTHHSIPTLLPFPLVLYPHSLTLPFFPLTPSSFTPSCPSPFSLGFPSTPSFHSVLP